MTPEARRIVTLLRTLGYQEVGSRGGHGYFVHPQTGKKFSVPLHPQAFRGRGFRTQKFLVLMLRRLEREAGGGRQ